MHAARTLKGVMLARLQESGGWMSREALAKGRSSSVAAIDEALADLVLEGQAQWGQGRGYRLAGTDLSRAAMKELRAKGLHRAVCARQVKDEYRVGVAEEQFSGGVALGVVMFEMAMPMPRPGPLYVEQHLAQVQRIVEFTKRGV